MKRLSLDVSFKPTSRVVTPEGYLCVKGIAARTGVYEYLSSELELDGPERIVKVYRSPEAVFSPDSMSGYLDKDVTNDHPDDLVTSETFKEHSVGHVRAAEQDGENVIVDLIIKDQEAIDAIESGKAELSPGYMAEYVPSKGVSPAGEPYEFEQRDIVINHVALVDAARAGKVARIFDSKPKGEPMAQRKVFLDAKKTRSVTLDEDAAAVVEECVTALESVTEEAQARADAAEAKADDLAEKVEALQTLSSDSAISEKVKAVFTVLDQAKKIAPTFDAKGSTDVLAIKRDALAVKYPTRDWAGKSEGYIAAAFDAASEEAAEEEDDDKKKTDDARKSLMKFADDFRAIGTRDARATSDGRAKYNDFLKGGAK